MVYQHAMRVDQRENESKQVELDCQFAPGLRTIVTLVEKIGSGATAEVYRASTSQVDQYGNSIAGTLSIDLAVKSINLGQFRLSQNYERTKEKLVSEVNIMSKVRHNGIVKLYAALETSEALYLLMERVKEGELFKAVCKSTMGEDEVRYIFRQLVETVRFLHLRDICHRDIKLENVLVDHVSYVDMGTGEVVDLIDVTSHINKGRDIKKYITVKLSDFGLSKSFGLIERAYSLVGTPEYWAPEVVRNIGGGSSGYDKRCDIWSLGCMLFILIVGRYPFNTNGTAATLNRDFVLGEGVLPKGVSVHLSALIESMLRVEPAERISLEDILASKWMNESRPVRALPYRDMYEETQNDFLLSAGSVLSDLKDVAAIDYIPNHPQPMVKRTEDKGELMAIQPFPLPFCGGCGKGMRYEHGGTSVVPPSELIQQVVHRVRLNYNPQGLVDCHIRVINVLKDALSVTNKYPIIYAQLLEATRSFVSATKQTNMCFASFCTAVNAIIDSVSTLKTGVESRCEGLAKMAFRRMMTRIEAMEKAATNVTERYREVLEEISAVESALTSATCSNNCSGLGVKECVLKSDDNLGKTIIDLRYADVAVTSIHGFWEQVSLLIQEPKVVYENSSDMLSYVDGNERIVKEALRRMEHHEGLWRSFQQTCLQYCSTTDDVQLRMKTIIGGLPDFIQQAKMLGFS